MFAKPYAKGQRPYDLRMIEDIAATLGSENKLTHDGPIYHVKINPNKDVWDVTCLGTECIDSPYKGKYYGVETLPTEFTERLAVLSILIPQQPEVVGVGLKVSDKSFWVYL